MADQPRTDPGRITWFDLTVPNASEIRDFYQAVVGWESQEVSMGDYSDFAMLAPGSKECVAGICYKKEVNADLPSAWLLYITVEDLDLSLERCRTLGGRIVAGPKQMGATSRYCVVEDPAGAVFALFEGAPAGF